MVFSSNVLAATTMPTFGNNMGPDGLVSATLAMLGVAVFTLLFVFKAKKIIKAVRGSKYKKWIIVLASFVAVLIAVCVALEFINSEIQCFYMWPFLFDMRCLDSVTNIGR